MREIKLEWGQLIQVCIWTKLLIEDWLVIGTYLWRNIRILILIIKFKKV